MLLIYIRIASKTLRSLKTKLCNHSKAIKCRIDWWNVQTSHLKVNQGVQTWLPKLTLESNLCMVYSNESADSKIIPNKGNPSHLYNQESKSITAQDKVMTFLINLLIFWVSCKWQACSTCRQICQRFHAHAPTVYCQVIILSLEVRTFV